MTDKSTLLKTFNTQFFDFLTDVITIFPDNRDIINAKKSFETIKRLNPTSIIKVWYSYIFVPYNDVISKGDLSFFLDKDYKTDLSILSNSNDILNIIDTLRSQLKNMGEANQNHSMNYIQILTKLSELYNRGTQGTYGSPNPSLSGHEKF
jgi:hypothetical protein